MYIHKKANFKVVLKTSFVCLLYTLFFFNLERIELILSDNVFRYSFQFHFHLDRFILDIPTYTYRFMLCGLFNGLDIFFLN